MHAILTAPSVDSVIDVRVAAFGTLRGTSAQLAPLRKNPGAVQGKPLSPTFLKHSDDQTVAAVATILRVVAEQGWQERSFRDWGVVAAPNLFGRAGIAQSLEKYIKDGAWGISPNLIPHHSLHAISGSISQALKSHGPNFGISGGPKAVAEGFLVAATILSERNLPGLWLALTGNTPELVPVRGGKTTAATPVVCNAAVLALEPIDNAETGLRLRVSPAASDEMPQFSLDDFLTSLETAPPTGTWRLPNGGWIDLTARIPIPSVVGIGRPCHGQSRTGSESYPTCKGDKP